MKDSQLGRFSMHPGFESPTGLAACLKHHLCGQARAHETVELASPWMAHIPCDLVILAFHTFGWLFHVSYYIIKWIWPY